MKLCCWQHALIKAEAQHHMSRMPPIDIEQSKGLFVMLHRVRQEVTHWTQASSNNHGNTVPIVLEEIIRDSEGILVYTSESKLGAVDSGGEDNESCFIVKASHIPACTVSIHSRAHEKQGHAAHARNSLCSHTSSLIFQQCVRCV